MSKLTEMQQVLRLLPQLSPADLRRVAAAAAKLGGAALDAQDNDGSVLPAWRAVREGVPWMPAWQAIRTRAWAAEARREVLAFWSDMEGLCQGQDVTQHTAAVAVARVVWDDLEQRAAPAVAQVLCKHLARWREAVENQLPGYVASGNMLSPMVLTRIVG